MVASALTLPYPGAGGSHLAAPFPGSFRPAGTASSTGRRRVSRNGTESRRKGGHDARSRHDGHESLRKLLLKVVLRSFPWPIGRGPPPPRLLVPGGIPGFSIQGPVDAVRFAEVVL